VDAIGGVGDACLKFATFGILDPGKDMRQAVGADIVNECSETYRKAKQTTDIVLKTTSACMGVGGLRADVSTIATKGAGTYFQDGSKAFDLMAGGADSINTMFGQ
jgi:hypothetical protein